LEFANNDKIYNNSLFSENTVLWRKDYISTKTEKKSIVWLGNYRKYICICVTFLSKEGTIHMYVL